MPAAFLPVLFRYVAAAHRDTIQQYISNAYILHYNEIFGKMVDRKSTRLNSSHR